MATRLESYALLVDTLTNLVGTERGHIEVNTLEIAKLSERIDALKRLNDVSAIKISNALAELKGVRTLIRTVEDHNTNEARRQEDGRDI